MSLRSLSKFYYGHSVTQKNRYISFSEGGAEIVAELRPGNYTLTRFAIEVSRAMSEAGSQDYWPTINRETRRITINADSNFELLCASGTTIGVGAYSLIGFSDLDRSGSNQYEGDLPSGYEYTPMMLLQSYVPFENFQEFVGSSVNKAINGDAEIISFGRGRFMECNIRYETNKAVGNLIGAYEQNLNALEDLREFLLAVTEAQKIEFMPDRDQADNYYSCLLDKTTQSGSGTGFKIRELFQEKLPDFYESGLLTFREIR